MADISSITLPSGNSYNLKDATARAAIAALEGGSYFLGVTTTALTDGATTNPITVDGDSVTAVNGNMVIYGNKEYVFYVKGNTKKWIEFGDLTTLGALAYKSSVNLSKGSGVNVLTSVSATAAASSVSFAAHTTEKVLSGNSQFSLHSSIVRSTMATVPLRASVSNPTISASGTAAAITGFGSHSKTAFVTGVRASTSKLETTTVPNVTSVGTASSWTFTVSDEVLTIGGGNGTAPTLGTAKTVATGSLDANGGGDSVATGASASGTAQAITELGTPSTSNCLTGVQVTAPGSVTLSKGTAEEAPGTGEVSIISGFRNIQLDDPTIDVVAQQVDAITALGAATAAAQAITIDTEGVVKVAKYDDLSVSV